MSVRTKLDNFKPRSSWIRYLVTYLTLFLVPLFARVSITGRRYFPVRGPFIIAINHFSDLDPAFVIYTFRRPMIFLAASDHKIEWFNYWAVWLYGFIPTNRKTLAPSTIRQAHNWLKSKAILGIFPEGTSLSQVLRPAKNGAVYLSSICAVPIVPMGITGLNKPWKSIFSGVRPKVTVTIGKPFGPFKNSVKRQDREKILIRNGREVMCRIAALLPEKQQGSAALDPLVERFRNENSQ